MLEKGFFMNQTLYTEHPANMWNLFSASLGDKQLKLKDDLAVANWSCMYNWFIWIKVTFQDSETK